MATAEHFWQLQRQWQITAAGSTEMPTHSLSSFPLCCCHWTAEYARVGCSVWCTGLQLGTDHRHQEQLSSDCYRCSRGLMLNKLLFEWVSIHAQILRQCLSRRLSQKLLGDVLINSVPSHFLVVDRECAVRQTETAFHAFVTATSKQISDFYFVYVFWSLRFPIPHSILLLALILF